MRCAAAFLFVKADRRFAIKLKKTVAQEQYALQDLHNSCSVISTMLYMS